MSNIPYHAWTHRPKAQGGTDPIEAGAPMSAAWGRIATTIPDNTVTNIIVGAAPFDVNHRWEQFGTNIVAADTDASAWTLAVAGGYAVNLIAFWQTFTGDRYLDITSSTTGDIQGRQPSVRSRGAVSPDYTRHEVSRLIYARDNGDVDTSGVFTGGDWSGLSDSTIVFKCFQNSGGDKDVELAYAILQTTKFLPSAVA